MEAATEQTAGLARYAVVERENQEYIVQNSREVETTSALERISTWENAKMNISTYSAFSYHVVHDRK